MFGWRTRGGDGCYILITGDSTPCVRFDGETRNCTSCGDAIDAESPLGPPPPPSLPRAPHLDGGGVAPRPGPEGVGGGEAEGGPAVEGDARRVEEELAPAVHLPPLPRRRRCLGISDDSLSVMAVLYQ